MGSPANLSNSAKMTPTPQELAGYPVTPPPLPSPVTFDQCWRELTFVHWPARPESVTHPYPPATRPDVFADGMTYVGLVPFVMSSIKLGTALPLPYYGSFLETSIRLCSVDDAVRHRSSNSTTSFSAPAV
jgi:uncharacterized protein